jgi:TPR repeat protein
LICANELNCVHAFNNLGQCYENGIGTTKNDQLAYKWYCRAAEMTHDAEALYRIAQMFAQERIPSSGNKDMEALKVYDLAVNATPDNHGHSCYQLGLYYLNGILDAGTCLLPPDICLSIEYFRTAADLNVQEAMLQLGVLFLNDDYTLEEQEEGLSRLQRAAELGLREAQFELGLFYHRGKEVTISALATEEEDEQRHHDEEEEEQEDTEECIVIPQDFEKSYDLFCRSAAQKHPTATYYLGIYHQHGIFVAPDLSIALEQYEIAVELFEKYDTATPDRWQAEFNLARILHQDVEGRVHAYELFQSAHLHAPDQYKFLSEIMIARYHLHGWANVSIQAEEAAATLIRFAQEEEKFGYRVYLQVAQCYELGLGVPKDLLQAFHWYGEVVSKAHILISANDSSSSAYDVAMVIDEEIEEDEACAMFKLAGFYRKGLVVAQDIKKADDLYRLAARKGSQAAQEYLSYMLQKTTLYD